MNFSADFRVRLTLFLILSAGSIGCTVHIGSTQCKLVAAVVEANLAVSTGVPGIGSSKISDTL